MTEYPKMMYRKGTSINFKGVDLDSIKVNNFEEEQEAKRNGYDEPLRAVERIKEKEKFFSPFIWLKTVFSKHWKFWLMFTVTLIGSFAALLQVFTK